MSRKIASVNTEPEARSKIRTSAILHTTAYYVTCQELVQGRTF